MQESIPPSVLVRYTESDKRTSAQLAFLVVNALREEVGGSESYGQVRTADGMLVTVAHSLLYPSRGVGRSKRANLDFRGSVAGSEDIQESSPFDSDLQLSPGPHDC